MDNSFWLPGYASKWICRACKAVHFYLPAEGCRRCDFSGLEEITRLTRKVVVEPVAEIQVKPDELRLKIDDYRLNEEWSNQVEQYYVWAQKVAKAQLEYDSAEARLALCDASLAKEIRENKEVYDIEKVTNEVVTATIEIQPEHTSAVSKVNSARYELGMVKAGLNALEHRKRALTMKVELWIRNYYSGQNSSDTPVQTKSNTSNDSIEDERAAFLARRAARLKADDGGTDGD